MHFETTNDLIPDHSDDHQIDGGIYDALLPLDFQNRSYAMRFAESLQMRSTIFAEVFPILSAHLGEAQ